MTNIQVVARNPELDFVILKSSLSKSFIPPWSDDLEARGVQEQARIYQGDMHHRQSVLKAPDLFLPIIAGDFDATWFISFD